MYIVKAKCPQHLDKFPVVSDIGKLPGNGWINQCSYFIPRSENLSEFIFGVPYFYGTRTADSHTRSTANTSLGDDLGFNLFSLHPDGFHRAGPYACIASDAGFTVYFQ